MLFLREILLLAVVLCVCWETGDNRCGMECDSSQRRLAQPICYLRDDGNETECIMDITNTELRYFYFTKRVNLLLDLQPRVISLRIFNSITSNVQLKVSTFRFHREITHLLLRYRNIQVNSGMFYFLPNLKSLRMISVFFEFFPYFVHVNRFLTHLHISEFDISTITPRILAGGHVSGLTGIKYLWLLPSQYINTTDQSFTGLTALTYLYLGSFHIPNPVTTLSPLVRLRELSFYKCGLTDITFLTRTPSLYGLTILTVYDNPITRIQPGIFSSYTNLVKLYLHSNRIARLECGTFIGLYNLKSLQLYSNPIQNICFTAFKGLESLAKLSLAFTSLTSPSSRMFEYLLRLKLIDLYRTPLHCECSLQWLSRVHHNFGLTSFNAICASPSEHINKAATDLSIYRDCTQDLSYQCFNRSIRCPSGTSCQDTLDTYLCVCQQEGDLFDRSLNRCVSSEELSSATTPTYTSSTCPTATSTCPTCPAATCPTYPSCPTATCPTATSSTCPSCPTATCPTCPTATCPTCPAAPCPSCPTATCATTAALPSKSPSNRP